MSQHRLRPQELTIEQMSRRGHITPEKNGEHAEELAPCATLVQLVEDLAITEKVSDTETVAISPRRRASASRENAAGNCEKVAKERMRHSAAQ